MPSNTQTASDGARSRPPLERAHRRERSELGDKVPEPITVVRPVVTPRSSPAPPEDQPEPAPSANWTRSLKSLLGIQPERAQGGQVDRPPGFLHKIRRKVVKYTKFIGPGFMVSVAYIDPGNYATDVAAGASYKYRLLFVILLSTIIAIFLQSLCIKLGTVTGMNLAENCKAHLPPWLNYVLYAFAEAAIIATDVAEVIGTAIALNILLKVPLVAGCAVALADVLVILFFYNPSGMSMRALRTFEIFVILLVLGVAVCFCYELSTIKNASIGEVMRGYLPSSAIVQAQGLYQSCGILGATVMPHSLYLGSGIVQSRLHDFDEQHQLLDSSPPRSSSASTSSNGSTIYRPSLRAIRSCLAYSCAELALSLFTFALFVNSAILIVAGASLSGLPAAQVQTADLFSIHDLLARTVAPVAGTIFALALLLSGTSAGIVCTIAGQMVSEGQLDWTVKPWVRRLATRSISILPSIVVAGAVGRGGLAKALEASQVALSIILPVVSAPLIWFTCSAKVMAVDVDRQMAPRGELGVGGETLPPGVPAPVDGVLRRPGQAAETSTQQEKRMRLLEPAPEALLERVVMKNGWLVTGTALLVWVTLTVMNVALLVLLGLGQS